jgi:ABC-type polysaccharide/polyol phosphate export permease
MIVITVVFSHMIKGVPNYNLYVLSGILMWNAISSSLSLGSGSIVANAGLLRKMRLPVWIFPMVAVSSSLTNFALALVPYMLFFLFEVRSLPNQVYLLPIVLSLFFLFLLGGALLLASLNVFFRDVSHVLDPILMIFFYATPVIYDRRLLGIPENIGRVLDLNPFTHFADAFRATLSVHGYIGWEQLLVLSGLAMASVLLGTVVYKKSVDKMIFSL